MLGMPHRYLECPLQRLTRSYTSASSEVKMTKLAITATVVIQIIPELPTTLIIIVFSLVQISSGITQCFAMHTRIVFCELCCVTHFQEQPMIGSENTILHILKLSKNEERKGVKYMFGVHDPQNPANV